MSKKGAGEGERELPFEYQKIFGNIVYTIPLNDFMCNG